MITKKVVDKIIKLKNISTGVKVGIIRNLKKAEKDNPTNISNGICLSDCFISYNNTPQGWDYWRLVAHLMGESAWADKDFPENLLLQEINEIQ